MRVSRRLRMKLSAKSWEAPSKRRCTRNGWEFLAQTYRLYIVATNGPRMACLILQSPIAEKCRGLAWRVYADRLAATIIGDQQLLDRITQLSEPQIALGFQIVLEIEQHRQTP